ncbi:MAG: hypothetical protein K9L64_02250 [Candidatus Izimaplasma sp.]|nr:hypothetical protein [Candidatus Izimaplasma bacterium]
MKKFKKPIKFYIYLFLLSVLVIGIYSIYRIINDNLPVSELYSIWILPVIFILIYYGSDSLLDKIFNRKKKIDYEGKFLDEIGDKMREGKEFLIEDYRRLQINEKFQSSLRIAYKIYKDGEDDVFNIEKLKRKFSKGSLEDRAIKYVINYLEENLDKDGKKPENKL